MNKTAIFIPARMESSRFPGKPLAPIDGIPMIVYCARNAIKTGLEVYVCTDSEEIMAVCSLYKVKAIITPDCETGTDRIAIAAKNMDLNYVITKRRLKTVGLTEKIKWSHADLNRRPPACHAGALPAELWPQT